MIRRVLRAMMPGIGVAPSLSSGRSSPSHWASLPLLPTATSRPVDRAQVRRRWAPSRGGVDSLHRLASAATRALYFCLGWLHLDHAAHGRSSWLQLRHDRDPGHDHEHRNIPVAESTIQMTASTNGSHGDSLRDEMNLCIANVSATTTVVANGPLSYGLSQNPSVTLSGQHWHRGRPTSTPSTSTPGRTRRPAAGPRATTPARLLPGDRMSRPRGLTTPLRGAL